MVLYTVKIFLKTKLTGVGGGCRIHCGAEAGARLEVGMESDESKFSGLDRQKHAGSD